MLKNRSYMAGLLKRYVLQPFETWLSTKIKGKHHVQGNVQVYNVRIPDGATGVLEKGSRRVTNDLADSMSKYQVRHVCQSTAKGALSILCRGEGWGIRVGLCLVLDDAPSALPLT